jgi:hypothetical protein
MDDGRGGRQGRGSRSIPNPSEAVTTPETAPPVNRPSFKLEGILWSEIPIRRVVVIGDKYLKEGDKISGVIIFKIDKKSVTFKSGNDTWTVRLR